MAFEFVARNGILSLSDITGSAGLQLTGLSADNSATTGLFKDGNDAVVTRAFGDLAFSSSIDISTNTNLVGGTNLTLNGDTMNLDANISLTSVTASFLGDLDGIATSASKADEIATKKKDTGTAAHYLTFVDSNNTAATKESVFTNTNITIKPSTGALTANSFTGSISYTDVDGLGNSATQDTGSMTVLSSSHAVTASYAANAGLSITTKNDSNDYAIVFHDSTGETLATDGTLADLKYNPSTNTLTTKQISATGVTASLDGTAATASYVAVADVDGLGNSATQDTGSMTVLSASRAATVNVSIENSEDQNYFFTTARGGVTFPTDADLHGHQALSFNPSTGVLKSGNSGTTPLHIEASTFTGSFQGDVDGTATSATQITVTERVGNLKEHQVLFSRTTGSDQGVYGDNGFKYIPTSNGLIVGNVTASFKGDLDGTATAADTIDVNTSTTSAEYRVTMVDNTGTGHEQLYVDTGLTFNPSTDKLTVTGDTAIGGNGSVTGDLTVGGTLTAQEFRTEYLTQVVIAQSGSTKLGNTVDDIHEVTGSLLVSEDLSVGPNLFVSSSVVSATGDVASPVDTIVAFVPHGTQRNTAIHFDYKIGKPNGAWYRTGTVMAVGESNNATSVDYTDTSTNSPSTNDIVFSCDYDTGGIKLTVTNGTASTIDVVTFIKRF